MPRRLPVRPAKVMGNFFALTAMSMMFFIYYMFAFCLYGPRAEKDTASFVILLIYNALFVMTAWSFLQTMTTDPGQVPVFWGFHLGDNENKRKRYCLMCNVFKPERCHHCSACNRCVLNMDHHCPWINNCVGFWNRKYFMLLLVYVLIITYFTAIFAGPDFVASMKWGFDNHTFSASNPELRRVTIICFAYFFNCCVAFLMTSFLRFQVKLMLDNKTTIENLDKQGQDYKS